MRLTLVLLLLLSTNPLRAAATSQELAGGLHAFAGGGPDAMAGYLDLAHYTQDACMELGIPDQVETLLSIFIRESGLHTSAEDGVEIGIGQTQRFKVKTWRKMWARRGVHLGPFKELRTQVYMAALEYRTHLAYARGRVVDAVRRYNGSGSAARHYAKSVMRARRNFFARSWRPDELASCAPCRMNP
jgi:hypothetical protein